VSSNDREFYEERVQESRARAAAAADPKIAAIHMELATRYSLLSIAATLNGDREHTPDSSATLNAVTAAFDGERGDED